MERRGPAVRGGIWLGLAVLAVGGGASGRAHAGQKQRAEAGVEGGAVGVVERVVMVGVAGVHVRVELVHVSVPGAALRRQGVVPGLGGGRGQAMPRPRRRVGGLEGPAGGEVGV